MSDCCAYTKPAVLLRSNIGKCRTLTKVGYSALYPLQIFNSLTNPTILYALTSLNKSVSAFSKVLHSEAVQGPVGKRAPRIFACAQKLRFCCKPYGLLRFAEQASKGFVRKSNICKACKPSEAYSACAQKLRFCEACTAKPCKPLVHTVNSTRRSILAIAQPTAGHRVCGWAPGL